MNKKIRRLALALLCAVLISSMPVCINAQTDRYVSPMKTEANPLYDWADNSNSRVAVQQMVAAAANDPLTDAEKAMYSTDLDAEKERLREQLTAHADMAKILYKGDGTFAAQIDQMGQEAAFEMVLGWFYEAMEHTGQSDQGDYLRWHYSRVAYGYSWYGYSNGEFYYTFEYKPTYLTTVEQEAVVEREVDALLDTLDVYDESNYEKAFAVYDWICSNVTYDHVGLENDDPLSHSAYAALVKKTAVCQGYATLLYRMLLELGVDNRVITSTTHGWNIVKMGDLYYNCDSTWDAGYDSDSWRYFLGGADAFANVSDHEPELRYETESFLEAYPMGAEKYVPVVEPVEPVAVRASGLSLLLEDEVCAKLYFAVENLPQDQAVEACGMRVYAGDPAGASATLLYDAEDFAAGSTDGEFAVWSKGIAAKEMGRTFWLEPHVKLADGSEYAGDAVAFSVLDYAQDILDGNYDDDIKALIASMLKYGAQAQQYFDYCTDAPADGALTEAQAALVADYSKDMLRTLQRVETEKSAAFAATASGFEEKAMSATVEGAFALNCYAAPDRAPDAGSMKLYVWTDEQAQSLNALEAGNADRILEMTDADGDGRWMASIKGIAAKEIDDAMQICMQYTAGGKTYSTGVIPCSVQSYCEQLMRLGANEKAQALAEAIVVYGSHADAYFA